MPGYPASAGPAPRAKATVGAAILLIGLAAAIIGAFLPWVTSDGESVNGFDNYYCVDELDCIASPEKIPESEFTFGGTITRLETPAILSVIGVAVTAAFALVLLLGGRRVWAAIVSLVLSAFGAFGALLFLVVAGSSADNVGGSVGIGVILQMVGALLAIAGSIVVLVKRNKAVAPPAYPAYPG